MDNPTKYAAGILGGLDYPFQNAQALTYFNKLITEGYTGAQSQSLYGINFNDAKELTDELFVGLVDDGLIGKIIATRLFQGGTTNTHIVNAVDPTTHQATMVNAPTQGANGMTLDGVNQLMRANIFPNVDILVQNNVSFGIIGGTNGQSENAMGVLQTATKRMTQFPRNTNDDYVGDVYGSGGGRILFANADSTGFWMYSRRAAADIEVYQDGVSKGTDNSQQGSLPNLEVFVGARNNNGTADSFTTGNIWFDTWATSMTDVEAANYSSRILTFNAGLGR